MSDTLESACPKCQYPRLEGALECPACGVVFAKLGSRRPSAPVAEPGAREQALNPYAAPQAPLIPAAPLLPLAEGIDASRWMRFVARFVDNLFVGVVPGVIYVGVIFSIEGKGEAAALGGCAALLVAILIGLCLWIYNLVRQARTGQTVGKTLCNLRVVRMHGEPPSADHFVWRREIVFGLLGAVPIVGPLISLADALTIFGAESRCLHDLLADTRVIEA